jgi:CHAT domain-containing protein
VKLVLSELETMGYFGSIRSAQCPRVWWIGCGMASSFPFHAAGVDFGPASLENTLSRVVPSYTPTIKALAHSRLRASIPTTDNAGKNNIDSILLVTMPTTVGQRSLPGVDKERNAIQLSCRGVCEVKELRLPTAKSVLEELDQSRIAHFACHGLSDPTNPYDSHLLLQKKVDGKATLDKLTMLEVSKLAAEQQLWVAFLSACSTVQVKAREFADEGLHLASAFQVAGFAHVIGALWPANDDACARIAGEFYTELTKHNKEEISQRVVAEALWQAVMQIRSEPNSNFSLWAPFVHIGA